MITLAAVQFHWNLVSKLGSAGITAITVIGFLITLIDRRKRGGEAGEPAIDGFTKDFAKSVRTEWRKELTARHLDESLIVSWEPMAADLTDTQDNPRQTGLLRAERRTIKLSEAGADLRDLLRKVPCHRLVVLGEPGTGKTVLLINLLLELFKKRKSGKIPVLLSLGSWHPSTQTLTEWLIEQLKIHYPALREPVSAEEPEKSIAEAFIEENRLIFILDGLDEIAEDQAAAIAEINEFLLDDVELVLSCRTEQYDEAVNYQVVDGDPVRVHLRGAAGICLRHLDSEAVRNFILKDMGRSPGDVPARWERVFRSIGTSDPVGQILRTPLMVGLACAIYNPRANERLKAHSLPPPEELYNTSRFGKPEEIEKYLLSAFVRASYRRRQGGTANRWQADDAERWLKFLAKHLEGEKRLAGKNEGRQNLAWWELKKAVPPWFPPLTVGGVSALAAGVAAALGGHVGRGIGIGLGLGMLVGLAIVLLPGEIARWLRHDHSPRLYPFSSEPKAQNAHFWERPYFWERRPVGGIAGGLIGAVLGALGAGYAGKMGIGHALWPFGGLSVAMGVGLGVGSTATFYSGLPAGLIGGFVAGLVETVGVGIPAGIVNGIGVGMTAGVIVILVGRTDPALKVSWNPSGVAGGLAIGAAVGLIASRVVGPAPALTMGIIIGAAAAWPLGQVPTNPDLTMVATPRKALGRDYRTFWMTALAAGLAAAAAGFVGGSLVSALALKAHPHLITVVKDGLDIGLAAGLVVGLTVGFYHAASGSFFLTRVWLTVSGNLPWRLMDFLVDAHEVRQVMRQTGAYYQFRHIKLQEELAAPGDSGSSKISGPTSSPRPDPAPGRRGRRLVPRPVTSQPMFGPALRPSGYQPSKG
jgi:hypothetical protein